MTKSSETTDLRLAYKNGDKTAMAELYRFYVDDVGHIAQRGFILDQGKSGRVLGLASPADQRELAQEVFSRAFSLKARSAYDVNQPFRPYLLRIAKNLMIDRLRRQGRASIIDPSNEDIDIDAVIERNAPIEACGDEIIDRQRLTAAVKNFVATLDQEARGFVQLRYLEATPQQEVAGKLGITRRRVRTLEGHVRLALQEYLQQHGLLELLGGSEAKHA